MQACTRIYNCYEDLSLTLYSTCPFTAAARQPAPWPPGRRPYALAHAHMLGQAPESAGNGDYARIGFRYYSADYAAIIPIIPPFFLKRGGFFLRLLAGIFDTLCQ